MKTAKLNFAVLLGFVDWAGCDMIGTMRNDIVHPNADKLEYEIRGIVAVAEKLQNMGVDITWENIGDPVAKGEKVPEWIKEIVKNAVSDDKSYAYGPTAGLEEAREYICQYKREHENIHITPSDVLFFNGLGDAISILYSYLKPGTKVIGPSPAYPTHSSADEANSGVPYITYALDPKNGWQPDLDELERKVRENPAIGGILTINPDNPTGFVYSREILEKIVAIAKEYDLFVISDEVYKNLTFKQESFVSVGRVAEEMGVPAVILRGMSKETPWPGARCGWAEFINRDTDESFDKYVTSLFDAKMLEVCATTLPQKVMPAIYTDPRFEGELTKRKEKYSKRADIAFDILKNVNGIIVPKPCGAFYMSVVFEEGVLNDTQVLSIENDEVREYIEKITKDMEPSTRFVYYLMGATGICVVPLSGFNSQLHGFRATLLEDDEKKFKRIFNILGEKIVEYLTSG